MVAWRVVGNLTDVQYKFGALTGAHAIFCIKNYDSSFFAPIEMERDVSTEQRINIKFLETNSGFTNMTQKLKNRMKEIDESYSKKTHKVVQKLKPCPFFLNIFVVYIINLFQ